MQTTGLLNLRDIVFGFTILLIAIGIYEYGLDKGHKRPDDL